MVMQRIGFLIPEFPQQTHIAWWRISDAMRKAGTEVQFLSTRQSMEPCPHEDLREEVGRTVYLWPPSIKDILVVPAAMLRFPSIRRYLHSLKARPGLARFKPLAFVPAALRLLRISRLRKLNHIFIHSCGDAAHVAALCKIMGGPDYSLRLGGDLEVYGDDHQAKMSGATLIVPAAQSYESRLINEIGILPKRVMWSWVGTDTCHFSPDPKPSTIKPRTSDAVRIITVARLNPSKGYQFMIPALGQLRDQGFHFRYFIVGDGPFREQITQILEEHRLGDSVELLGSRDTDQIAALLRSSDLFVLPTSGIGEGTPASVCEAMSAGLPIVATRVGGLSDMINDGVEGYLVPPGDIAALAQAIARLSEDPTNMARMGENARRKAVAEFNSQAVAKKILDKIEALTRNPPEELPKL